MLRLIYLAFLYWWYGGSLLTLSEELPAESSVEGSDATSACPHVPYYPSGENRRPEGHSIPPAPATDSQLQHLSTSPTAAALESAERGVRSTSAKGGGGVHGGGGHGELREELNQLKRVVILDKLAPLTVLISIVSDLDVLADWYFFEEGLDSETQLLFKVALAFTVVGTVMYVLLTLEFHPISKLQTRWAGKPLSPLQHVPLGWQLAINVVVEDIPQLVITCLASPDSVAGVLNITTAVFSLMAKIAEGVATRKDLPIASQLSMVEEDPGVVRHMVVQQRKAQQLAANAAELAVLVNKFKEGSNLKRQRAFAFEIMQVDPGFLNGSLNYVREKLESEELDLEFSGLKGSIPSSLGDLKQLTNLNLFGNKLSGPIPSSLAELTQLTTLNLLGNGLSGSIPCGLGELGQLTELSLESNMLGGSIPPSFGVLMALTSLDLSLNQLTGPIPPELGGLTALTSLNLRRNKLTGSIPSALGGLVALTNLDLRINHLTGSIPPALGGLTSLTKLGLSNNKLIGSVPDELGELRSLNDAWFYGNSLSGVTVTTLQLVSAHLHYFLTQGVSAGEAVLGASLGTKRMFSASFQANVACGGFRELGLNGDTYTARFFFGQLQRLFGMMQEFGH